MPKGQYDRSTMKRAGTNEKVLLKDDYKQQFYQRKKRGRKEGNKPSFEELYENQIPRTPFEKLQFDLRMNKTEFAKMIDVTVSAISAVVSGRAITTVPVAKRMQEEAWSRGIPVTLDELYQHVIPWRTEEETVEGEE